MSNAIGASIYRAGDRVNGINHFAAVGIGTVIDHNPDNRNARGRSAVLVAWDNGNKCWMDEDDTEFASAPGESIFEAIFAAA